ncbi:hypothetical protein BH10BAC4_BH10BAC4_05760 [soil metagenome]
MLASLQVQVDFLLVQNIFHGVGLDPNDYRLQQFSLSQVPQHGQHFLRYLDDDNHQNCFPFKKFVKFFHDCFFIIGIKGGGGLVKEDHLWVFIHGARDQ